MSFFRKNKKRALALAMVFTMFTTLLPSDFVLAEEMTEDSVKVVSESTESVTDLSSEEVIEDSSSESASTTEEEQVEIPSKTTTDAATEQATETTTEVFTEASTEVTVDATELTTEVETTGVSSETATTESASTETVTADTTQETTESHEEATTEEGTKEKEMEEDETPTYHHSFSGYTTKLGSKTSDGYYQIYITKGGTSKGVLCYDHGKKMISGLSCSKADFKIGGVSSKKAYFAAVAWALMNQGAIDQSAAIPLAWAKASSSANGYYGKLYAFADASYDASKINGKQYSRTASCSKQNDNIFTGGDVSANSNLETGVKTVNFKVSNTLITKLAQGSYNFTGASGVKTSVELIAKGGNGANLKAFFGKECKRIFLYTDDGKAISKSVLAAMGGATITMKLNIPGAAKYVKYLDFDTYYDKSTDQEWMQELVVGYDGDSFRCTMNVTADATNQVPITAHKVGPVGVIDDDCQFVIYYWDVNDNSCTRVLSNGGIECFDPTSVKDDADGNKTISLRESIEPKGCFPDVTEYQITFTPDASQPYGYRVSAKNGWNHQAVNVVAQTDETGAIEAYYLDTSAGRTSTAGFYNAVGTGGFELEKKSVTWAYNSSTKQFDSTYSNTPGIKFKLYAANNITYPGTDTLYLSAGQQITHDYYNRELNLTTNQNGKLACDGLMPGNYYLVEDQSTVGQVGSITDLDYEVFTVHTNFTTTLQSMSQDAKTVFNEPVSISASFGKVDGEGQPVQGAEFTLYAYVGNPSGNKNEDTPLFTDANAVSAMIGVSGGEPVMSAKEWVPIATTTSQSQEGNNVTFDIQVPIGYYLIAETKVPDGYVYHDYDNYAYAFNVGATIELNGSKTNVFANNMADIFPGSQCKNVVAPNSAIEANTIVYNGSTPALFIPSEPIVNDVSEFSIQLYKTGDMITGAENVSTPYGIYKRITFTEDMAFPGVTFELWKNGVKVATRTTDKDGYAEFTENDLTLQPLQAGDYLLKEVNNGGSYYTPWGKEGKPVTLTNQGGEKVVVDVQQWDNEYINTRISLKKKGEIATPMVDTDADATDFTLESNEPIKEGELTLLKKYKVYEKSVANLKGAVFAIYTAEDITAYNGTVIIKKDACVGIAVSDAEGNIEFSDKLKKGNYYLKEIKTSSNLYKLPTDTYPIEIVPQNEDVEIDLGEIVNELYAGSITIVKVDSKNKDTRLEGVVFNLYDESKKLLGSFKTNEQGQITITDLPIGKYYVQEVSSLDGYVLDGKEYAVYVTADNLYQVKTITNAKTYGQIKVIKVDADNHTHTLSGVSFELLDANQNVLGVYTTGEDGTLITEELPYGTYFLRETVTQAGYILDNTVYEINLTDENRFPELTVYNAAYKGSIKVIKTNGDKTIYLKGVVFNLYDSAKNLLGTYTTDENGEIYIAGLRCGTYYIQETETQKGYTLDDSLFQIDLTETDLNQILELVNEEESLKVVDEEDLSADTEDDSSSVKTGSNLLFILFCLMLGCMVAGFILDSSEKKLMKEETTQDAKSPIKEIHQKDNFGKPKTSNRKISDVLKYRRKRE